MLGRLHDQHVVLTNGSTTLRTYEPNYAANWDNGVWQQYLARANAQLRGGAVSAVFSGVPYIAIQSWNPGRVSLSDLDAFLDAFRDRSGLILDVRIRRAVRRRTRRRSCSAASRLTRFRDGSSTRRAVRSSRIRASHRPSPCRHRPRIFKGAGIRCSTTRSPGPPVRRRVLHGETDLFTSAGLNGQITPGARGSFGTPPATPSPAAGRRCTPARTSPDRGETR